MMDQTIENKFYSETKLSKLKVHPRSFSSEDLIVNLEAFIRDKFQLFEENVVEIFAPEDLHGDQRNHLLLEVKELPPEIQAKGGPLSISTDVAQAFKLNGLKNVYIRRVNKKEVGLDMVEVRFKDQTMTRSDMWRFTQSLLGKGMYSSRKFEFIHMRAQVTNLWALGDIVRSGVVVDSTRLVFRSLSAQLFLGIQISSEMWEFDPQGDIYFDKAVDGFLKCLFNEWKKHQCNHKVTLFLFARRYYKLTGKPMANMERPSIQKNKKGQYYEDFYQVIVDEESHDDWRPTTVEVKKSFLQFQKMLRPDSQTSDGGWYVSSSNDGNFLEAINMAVNVFEHHYIDTSFTTTGQQILLVSPGVGVFEVDYEMNRLTKERIIDFGIGVDLVCLNEQPFHAVPLFKYQQQHLLVSDIYYIPHWINYSYYNPPQRWMKYQFHPRIKMSDSLINKHLKDRQTQENDHSNPTCNPFTVWSRPMDSADPLSRVDYDEYDDMVFSSAHSSSSHHSGRGSLFSSSAITFDCGREDNLNETIKLGSTSVMADDDEATPRPQDKSRTFELFSGSEVKPEYYSKSLIPTAPRHHSDNYDQHSIMDLHSSTLTEAPPTLSSRVRVGSAEETQIHRINNVPNISGPRKKSFINPFDPNKVHMEDSSHKHRWMHTFPRDKLGHSFQTHHVARLERVDENTALSISAENSSSSLSSGSSSSVHSSSSNSPSVQRRQPDEPSTSGYEHVPKTKKKRKRSINSGGSSSKRTSAAESFATVRRTGMDWTSLLEPASLPLTTDYFPDDNIINSSFVQYPGSVTPVNYGNETAMDTTKPSIPVSRSERQNISPVEAFREMISQRLAQGFQLVFTSGSLFSLYRDLQDLKTRKKKTKGVNVLLSLGRVFHVVRLLHPDILTYIYRPKNSLGIKPFHYYYQLMSCCRSGNGKGESKSSEGGRGGGGGDMTGGLEDVVLQPVTTSCWFTPVIKDRYNWNYLDQHICGYEDFEEFQESNKYWRCRLLLLPFTLPSSSASQEATARWLEDIISGFVRFIEFLNHIKRGSRAAMKRPSVDSTSSSDSLYMYQRYVRSSLPTSPVPRPLSPFSSRSPSPSPVLGKSRHTETHHSNLQPPGRSGSEPSGRTRATVHGRQVPRPSLPAMGSRPADSGHQQSHYGRTVQTNRPLPGNQPASRSSQDIVESLRQLTLSPKPQGTSSPKARGRRPLLGRKVETDSVETVSEEDEERDSLPVGFNIIPPSPLMMQSDYFDNKPHPLGDTPDSEGEALSLFSSPPRILHELLDPEEGVDLLGHQPGLRPNCFVAMEAVKWLMDKISGTVTRAEAVKALQKLVSESLIVHASGNKRIPFIDGFFLYCPCVSDLLAERGRRSDLVDMDWETYRKSWFEVNVYHPSLKAGDRDSLFSSSYQSSGSPYYMDYREDGCMSSEELDRSYYLVELNPDSQSASDRPEWCCVRYSSTFHHMRGFELEFQWMATTVSLLKKMIQGWNYKAAMCQFNLVPVPSMAMLKNEEGEQLHPFRRPVLIPISLTEYQQKQFTNFEKRNNLFEAILTKFGFLIDPASLPSESEMVFLSKQLGATSRVYIHHSGCALVQPVCEGDSDDDDIEDTSSPSLATGSPSSATRSPSPSCLTGCVSLGFHWFKNNLYLRQKSTPATMIGKHQTLFTEVKQFCDRTSDGLTDLCLNILQ